MLCAGVGAKRGRDEGWIQHQDNFDELLAGLNKKQTENVKVTNDDDKKTLVESANESKRIT